MIALYWSKLSDRDQWAMLIGGCALGVYLLYSLLYAPLTQAVQEARTTLIEQRETLTWIKAMQPRLAKRISKKSVSSTKLLGIITQELSQATFRFFPFNLQQINSSDIQLNFDRVPFSDALIWLWELQSQYQINIRQLSLDKLSKPGLVKASIILQGSN